MSKAEIAKLPQYDIKAHSAPEPKKLVVKDLWKGSGAALEPGDRMLVNFAGAHYNEAVRTTPATRNVPTEFGFEEVVDSWKEGVPGMRVGGRRELIVPHAIDYENGTKYGTYVYVIDLLAIKRP